MFKNKGKSGKNSVALWIRMNLNKVVVYRGWIRVCLGN